MSPGSLAFYGISSDTPSFADVCADPPPRKMAAYCSGRSCVGTKLDKRGIAMRARDLVRKFEVKKNQDLCPDCGSALVWKKVRTVEGVAS